MNWGWTAFADENKEDANPLRTMNSFRRCALVSTLFLASAIAAEPPSFPDLSGYNFTDTFSQYWLAPHRNGGIATRHKWEPLMALTTFHEGMALEYFTGPKGENYSVRNVGTAKQNTQGKELKAEDVTRLQALLKELPATNTLPERHRLVLLSHRDGTNWITRAFDNGDRPKALQEIFQVIGERWDEYGKPPPR